MKIAVIAFLALIGIVSIYETSSQTTQPPLGTSPVTLVAEVTLPVLTSPTPSSLCHNLFRNKCPRAVERRRRGVKKRTNRRDYFCDEQFNKAYLFYARLLTYEDSVDFCAAEFGRDAGAGLVQLHSCQEYDIVKAIISDVAKAKPKLFEGRSDGTLMVWTHIGQNEDGSDEKIQDYAKRFNQCPKEHQLNGGAVDVSSEDTLFNQESADRPEFSEIVRYSLCQLDCSGSLNATDDKIHTESPLPLTFTNQNIEMTQPSPEDSASSETVNIKTADATTFTAITSQSVLDESPVALKNNSDSSENVTASEWSLIELVEASTTAVSVNWRLLNNCTTSPDCKEHEASSPASSVSPSSAGDSPTSSTSMSSTVFSSPSGNSTDTTESSTELGVGEEASDFLTGGANKTSHAETSFQDDILSSTEKAGNVSIAESIVNNTTQDTSITRAEVSTPFFSVRITQSSDDKHHHQSHHTPNNSRSFDHYPHNPFNQSTASKFGIPSTARKNIPFKYMEEGQTFAYFYEQSEAIESSVQPQRKIDIAKLIDRCVDVASKLRYLAKNLGQQPLKNVTAKIFKSVSKAFDHDTSWVNFTRDQRSKNAYSMIDSINSLSLSLACNQETKQETMGSESIELETIVFDSGIISSSLSFPFNMSDVNMKNRISFSSNVQFDSSEWGSCGRNAISSVMFEKKIADHLISGSTVPSSKFFSKSTDQVDVESVHMNSNLISFTVSEESNEPRTLPNNSRVRITFKHLELLDYRDNVACAFWHKNISQWSSANCSVVASESFKNQTTCECNHLTNFAVLMDISGRQRNDTIKSIISIVCCSISIIGLLLTLLSMILVKGLRNRRCIITCNLCLCLLAINILVIFFLDSTSNETVCRIVSGALLYFLLSSFAWMQLQGYLLYQMIILVFQSVGYVSPLTLFVVGYIPSLIILGVFIGLAGVSGLYEKDVSYFCWISNQRHTNYIWTFAGPAFIIVAVNMIVLVRSFRVAWKSQTTRNSRSSQLVTALRFLKGWTSLVILVGATWSTGLLLIHRAVPWTDYIFISLNALQGAFIFLFEIVLNSKIRSLLTKLPVRNFISLTSSSSGNVTASSSLGGKSSSKLGYRGSKSSSTSQIISQSPPATWYANYFPSGAPPSQNQTVEAEPSAPNLPGIYNRSHVSAIHTATCKRLSHHCDTMKDYPNILPIPVAPPTIPEATKVKRNDNKFNVCKVDHST